MRTRLTDRAVRIAELLRRPDDVYHTAYRQRELCETTLVPVGPQLQELGSRFALSLSQGSLEGRTVVWLTLSNTRPVAEVVDPFGYDPESEGEPERLLTSSEVRWGMATSFVSTGTSVMYRMLLYVPESALRGVEDLLDRLAD